MAISADEWEVLGFFEVEPTATDVNVPWPYNDYLYELTRGDLSLSCAIAPAYQDIHLLLKRGDSKLYEFKALGVKDVRLLKQKGNELLEIVVSARDRLWLRVKPDFQIIHESASET